MNKQHPKLLFITHESTRTGAPLLLLNLLKWMKQNTTYEFCLLIKRNGILTSEFENSCKTFYYEPKFKGNIAFRCLRLLHLQSVINYLHFLFLKVRLKNQKITLIYSNTITNGELLKKLSFLKCKTITHAHELQYVIDYFGKRNIELVKNYSHAYIACSNAVKLNLIENYQIPTEKITTIYEYPILSGRTTTTPELKQQFSLPQDAFIIGSSGTIEWRKGYDLFIQLAIETTSRDSSNSLYFVWVGNFENEVTKIQFHQDIEKANLKNRILHIDSIPNPFNFYTEFGVFALLSREDPFPLVALECAYFEKPVLCFENAGGMPEFVENDAGFIIPYLDIEAMADRIIELRKNPELCHKLGQTGKTKIVTKYTIDTIAPQIMDCIEKTFISQSSQQKIE